jgi:lipopolysaccharide export system protein LptA
MRFLWISFFIAISLYGQKVEISADSFEADEKKMYTILKGNVLLKKGADTIHAATLTVYFDADNKPIKYLASGNITFDINTEKQSFDGHADQLLYNPKTLIYEVSGNAFIHEKLQNRKLYGEHIMIDRVSGKSTIKGSKKRPVKFIFEVKE